MDAGEGKRRLENSKRAAAVNLPQRTNSGAASTWLVSPWFDLLFFANLTWLLALVPGYVSSTGQTHLEFWQIYFLTTPHRWIPLVLVASDPDRRAGRNGLFAGIAVLAAILVVGIKLGTGAFWCLLVVDYLWNSWHFGAQHGGILRMYARRAGGGHPFWETWSLRLLVCYTSIRLAGWSTGWVERDDLAYAALPFVDYAFMLPACALFCWEAYRFQAARLGKLTYLTSVTSLYVILLFAIQRTNGMLIAGLTVASAAFHAIEYLAIVSYYARRRQEVGSKSVFQQMARRWLQTLGIYILALGIIAVTATKNFVHLWMGLNLWAAFLHYAYDGLIWKLRQSATARSLAVEVNTGQKEYGG